MILLPLFLMMQGTMLQPGANPSPQRESELPIPRKKAEKAPAPLAPVAVPLPTAQQDRLALCLAKVRTDPDGAAKDADAWIAESPRTEAQHEARLCLGIALAALQRWEAAEQTFTGLSLETPVATGGEDAIVYRSLAGTAALAGGFPERAIVWLDQAAAGGATLPPAQLGGIQIDRARALVALERPEEAKKALDEVHRLIPNDSEGWLLSATLLRRQRDLVAAQKDIETAAALDPRDPAIGLEAGVIAMLDGREPSARKSWASVIAAAPDSNEARIARGYLEQIGPEQAAPAAPVKP
jgi:tetratricopeptide (TPR) repeat protein